MKWLIVVVFNTMVGDAYLFTNPEFDSREECMTYIQDPDIKMGMLIKLQMEYGRPKPIRFVNCMEKDVIEKLMNGEQDL